VQVHVDDVEAHVARADLAEDGVEVGTVVVQQAARVVDDALDVHDPALEDAERARVGQHDSRGLRTDRRPQGLDVHVAVVPAGDLADLHATHGGGRGIRAVGGFRNDDLVARQVAAGTMIGADHGDARELALGAGHGRQRHGLHAGHCLEHLLQLVHALEEALPGRLGRERVSPEELGKHRVGVAGLRVVLHRARAERVEVGVDAEVHLRQAREMPYGLEFRDLREHRRRATAKMRRDLRLGGGGLLGGRRPARTRQLEDDGFASPHGWAPQAAAARSRTSASAVA